MKILIASIYLIQGVFYLFRNVLSLISFLHFWSNFVHRPLILFKRLGAIEMKTYCGVVASLSSIEGSFVNSVFSENWGFGGETFALCPDVLDLIFDSSWNFDMALASLESGDDFLSTTLFSGSRWHEIIGKTPKYKNKRPTNTKEYGKPPAKTQLFNFNTYSSGQGRNLQMKPNVKISVNLNLDFEPSPSILASL